jgi:hypothetical protein
VVCIHVPCRAFHELSTQVIQPGVGEHQNNALFTAPRPFTARKLYVAAEKDCIRTLADNLKTETGGKLTQLVVIRRR